MCNIIRVTFIYFILVEQANAKLDTLMLFHNFTK